MGAIRDGEGTAAARLLRRAAADAREHVALSRALTTTAGVPHERATPPRHPIRTGARPQRRPSRPPPPRRVAEPAHPRPRHRCLPHHCLQGLLHPCTPHLGHPRRPRQAMAGDTRTFHDLWLAASSPPDAPRPTTPAIAGRRPEMAAVRRHLTTGSGLLLVTGEAGIGKTRLVTTTAWTTDTFVATGHCLPLSAQAPLMPVADAFRDVLESDGGRWLEDRGGREPALGGGDPGHPS